MTELRLEVGELYWTDSGQEVMYAGSIDGGMYVVHPIIHLSGGDDYPPEDYPSEDVILVKHLSIEEPEFVMASTISREKERLEKLCQDYRDLQMTVKELTDKKAELEANAERYPDVRRLIDFIEGKITHVVLMNNYSYLEIIPLHEALEMKDSGDFNGLKLLHLYGYHADGKQPNTRYFLNRYNDGSGSGEYDLFPFYSLAEAQAYVMELFEADMARWMSDETAENDKNRINFSRYRDLEPDLKFPWPQKYLDHKTKKSLMAYEEKLQRAEESLNKIIEDGPLEQADGRAIEILERIRKEQERASDDQCSIFRLGKRFCR